MRFGPSRLQLDNPDDWWSYEPFLTSPLGQWLGTSQHATMAALSSKLRLDTPQSKEKYTDGVLQFMSLVGDDLMSSSSDEDDIPSHANQWGVEQALPTQLSDKERAVEQYIHELCDGKNIQDLTEDERLQLATAVAAFEQQEKED